MMKKRQDNKQDNKQYKSQDAAKKRGFWRRLAMNKWSMTFAAILVVLAAYMGQEQAGESAGDGLAGDQTAEAAGDVIYVTDELPYAIQKVSGEGSVDVLTGEKDSDESVDEKADGKADGKADEKTAGDMDESLQVGIEQNLNQSLLGFDDDGESGDYSINSDSDFFINYRLEREKVRSRQLEMLQQLIDDENTGQEVRSSAQAKIIAQTDAIEQELTLESILVAKYGGEAAVFIQPEKINLVLDLDTEAISDNEAEKIARLVDNYTGVGYENIIIVLKD